MHGDFTWTDLSTFDVKKAKAFYGSVFRWEFSEDETGYANASIADTPVAGLYDMPEFFRKIRMPSFWMPYIEVSDVDAVASRARELGGKVELEESNGLGRIALIRDPLGAGFTCYEGSEKSGRQLEPYHGGWSRWDLFVSELPVVKTFYLELFDWKLKPDPDSSDRHWILNGEGRRMGAIQVAGNEVRGDKEFWAVVFEVRNAKAALTEIENAGGRMVFENSNSDGTHFFAEDSQGATFMISENREVSRSRTEGDAQTIAGASIKWRSIVGLIAVYAAILFEANWIWGALFLFWVIPDLKSGVTYFIEPLSRRDNPILYWAVVLTWIGLSAFLLITAG